MGSLAEDGDMNRPAASSARWSHWRVLPRLSKCWHDESRLRPRARAPIFRQATACRWQNMADTGSRSMKN